MSVCPEGCPLPFVSPQPSRPLCFPGGPGPCRGLEPAARCSASPPSSSRLGYNVLGNDTVLRLAQRLPHHLKVLQ